MDNQRWRQIDEIFQSTVEISPDLRQIFLDKACSGDSALQAEVVAMLNADKRGCDLMETSALEAAAPLLADDTPELAPGKQIGRYEVVKLIGRGGMGEVYLARDKTLRRQVALKLLPEDYTKDKSRVVRFQQEAQSASALNHPNILTIHEIGRFGKQQFIATEFVEGETLRQRLNVRRLNLDEAADIAIQVVSALAAAHEAGIVHRDIKPDNIMIRPDGYVKLLDFGLAKLTDSFDEQVCTPPTADMDISSGLLMGTAMYMSPEQARGIPVDARSDIFSVGVLLYEMVSGRLPFKGRTSRDFARSILEDVPAPLAEPEVPADLQRVICKALEKDRSERYNATKNLLADLMQVRRQLEHTTPAHSIDRLRPSTNDQRTATIEPAVTDFKSNKTRSVLTIAILVVLTGIGAYGLTFLFAKRTVSFDNIKATSFKTSTRSVGSAAISPDGKLVAYSDEKGIWLNSLDGNDTAKEVVRPAEVPYSGLAFSSDGKSLYFNRQGDLHKVSLDANGSEAKVLEQVHSRVAVSPDNKQLAFIRTNLSEGESALVVANADGTGEKRLATRKDFLYANGPAWSPDGAQLVTIVEGGHVNASAILTFDVATGKQDQITTLTEWPRFRDVAWLSDRSIVLVVTEGGPTSTTQLWHLSYPGWHAKPISGTERSFQSISVASSTSALLAVERETPSDIWTMSLADDSGATQITSTLTAGRGGVCSMSDGRIIYHSRDQGIDGIWSMNADGTNRQNLTPDSHGNFYPSVSADGRYVVFMSRRTGTLHLWQLDTKNNQQLQITGGFDEQFPQVTADGKQVYYVSWDSGIGSVWRVSINGGQPSQVVSGNSSHPQVSPNGSLLTYVVVDNTHRERRVVHVNDADTDYPSAGRLYRSFEGPLAEPRWVQWSAGGDALLYLAHRNGAWNIWSQPLSGASPKQLTHFTDGRIYFFAPSHDGKSLVFSRGKESRSIVLFNPQ